MVCGAIQSLREICNELVEADSSPCPSSLPDWCHLDRAQSRLWQNITDSYNPLENISLDQINLVFLSQEMTTTGIKSRLIQASLHYFDVYVETFHHAETRKLFLCKDDYF